MIGIDNQEELLSIPEAAELLGVSINTVKSLVRHGRIRHLKLDRRYFFHPEDLMAFFSNLLIDPFIKIGG